MGYVASVKSRDVGGSSDFTASKIEHSALMMGLKKILGLRRMNAPTGQTKDTY